MVWQKASRSQDERGFTLIELLIIVAIIAILIPNFLRATYTIIVEYLGVQP